MKKMPPKIDQEKCSGCGECVNACPVSVIEVNNKKAKVTKPDDCVDCRACEAVCTTGAITFPE